MSQDSNIEPLDSDSPTYIIAEAGMNHNGDYDRAVELVESAADAGANAVKFQSFRAENLYPKTDEAYDELKRFEMPDDWVGKLASLCDQLDIDFLSSPFDKTAVDTLEPHVPLYKIASATLSHHDLIRYIAEKRKPLIVSTGIHNLTEIAEAVEVIQEVNDDIVLLHCVSAYPTPIHAANVRMVESLRERFEVPTGLSDHTEDPTLAPTAAVALGATVIEKHITTDNSLPGPDHSMALEPDELESLVDTVRETETVLGSAYSGVLDVEAEGHANARRTIVATEPISAGEQLTESNTAVLRANGRPRHIKPSEYNRILGTHATRSVSPYEPISHEHLSN